MTHSWQTSNEWEKIPTPNYDHLRPGDELVYDSWNNITIKDYGFIIESVDSDHVNAFPRSNTRSYPYEKNNFDDGWWRKVTEIPYDPSQMADEEDDI